MTMETLPPSDITGGAPASETPPPGAPAIETPPAVNDDPYNLYEGMSADERSKAVLDRRRNWSKEDRAAADVLVQTILQKRLAQQAKKYDGLKYGDKDLEAKIIEARSQWEKEHGVPAAPDADEESLLSQFDPEQRKGVQAILETTKKREAKLREELDGIRKPLQERELSEQQQALKTQMEEVAKSILEKVPTIDPYTIVDILRVNAAKDPDERLTEEEVISMAQEIEDERFESLLPARLSARDKKTNDLLINTVVQAVQNNEEWAAELMATMISQYEEAKRGAPAGERPGSPTAPSGTVKKWNPQEAIHGY